MSQQAQREWRQLGN